MPARKLGTWKLAYADFLTALAAFFLLMWLVSGVSQDDRAVIAAEFTGKLRPPTAASAAESALVTLDLSPALKAAGDSVRVSASADSVTIELVDTAGRPLFGTGSGALTEDGHRLVRAAAETLFPLGAALSIEGHTDAFTLAGAGFSNWDLSTARANEARRTLEEAGIAAARIRAVTGYADTRPLSPGQPHLAANRRISLQIHLTD